MKTILSVVLSVLLSLQPVLARANLVAGVELPPVGERVLLSPAFQPSLMRGLTIDPAKPLQFDFILDPGTSGLKDDELRRESSRMIHYFLAALTIPQKDLWVNLSPVEKDRIVPDALIRTELGRDLLAQDYVLKQLTASLIYPEEGLGQVFWRRVYDEAYTKFGVTDVPVDAFNKVWIVPERASVFEKGNTVYIVKAHLKVMLEADYLALERSDARRQTSDGVQDLAKSILREVIVPAIEKEVNEGKNFARLRQAVYALVLAQWYQDVLKESVLSRVYSGQNKIAGIDVSDPASKQKIYEQYLAAHKKGVFDYIKEEPVTLDVGRQTSDEKGNSGVLTSDVNRLTSDELIPRKYFSGGFSVPRIPRDPATPAMALGTGENLRVRVDLEPANPAMEQKIRGEVAVVKESYDVWNDSMRPLAILKELRDLQHEGRYQPVETRAFIEKYSPQVEEQAVLFPVQSAWPVLKAIALLGGEAEENFVSALVQAYAGEDVPLLVDKIRTMHESVYIEDWVAKNTPSLQGRVKYNFFAEMAPAEGGLGEVAENEVDGELALNMRTVAVQPWYVIRPNGERIDYSILGLKNFNENFMTFDVQVGDVNGWATHTVRVQIAKAENDRGVPVYFIRDIGRDGQPYKDGVPYYMKMLYNYSLPNNPVTKEESISFMNRASAKLFWLLEKERRQEEGAAWKPAVIHANDGQYAPLLTTLLSMYGEDEVIRDVVPGVTTHTIFNTGTNDLAWGVDVFLKHMLGIRGDLADLYKHATYLDHTTGGLMASVNMGGVALGVSNTHAIDMSKLHKLTILAMTNGAKPEKLAMEFNRAFQDLQRSGMIPEDADHERPTAEQDLLTKREMKKRLNALGSAKVQTASGRAIAVDIEAPLFGDFIRSVWEKVSITRAWTRENILKMVQSGVNIVRVNRYQGPHSDPFKQAYMALEDEIVALKTKDAERIRQGLPALYPGNFFYVIDAKPEVKPFILGALDAVLQDPEGPDPRVIDGVTFFSTGAAEYSEAYPAGAYVVTGKIGVGVVKAQGVLMSASSRLENGERTWFFERPGEGNTVTPQEDNAVSWWETAIKPLIALYQTDRLAFYEGASKTAWLIRIMNANITAGDNLRVFHAAARNLQEHGQQDTEVLARMVQSLAANPGAVFNLIVRGRHQAQFLGKEQGLRSFTEQVRRMKALDAKTYLNSLFQGLSAGPILQKHIQDIENGYGNEAYKAQRLIRFMASFVQAFEMRMPDLLITRNDAEYLLSHIENDFYWRDGNNNEVARTQRGLKAFVDNFNRLKNWEDIWRHHRWGKDIVDRLHATLSATSRLALLKADLQDELDQMERLQSDQTAEKKKLTLQIMEKVSAAVVQWEGILNAPARAIPSEQVDAEVSDGSSDQAMKTLDGGIDARNIGVDRSGELIRKAVSDGALESILSGSPGVRAVIMSVTPMGDLRGLLGLPS